MLYGLERAAMTKRKTRQLDAAEIFSFRVTRKNNTIIINECIKGTLVVDMIGQTVRQAMLRWYGHMKRTDADYLGRNVRSVAAVARKQETGNSKEEVFIGRREGGHAWGRNGN